MENLIIHIQSFLNAVTKAEKKVAEIVLTEKDKIILGSITDLAEKAGVGETTVLRFCRKIGFKGFQEFKFALAKEFASPVYSPEKIDMEENHLLVIGQKITVANVQAIQDTTSILDLEQIQKAVNELSIARKIHFYGVGSSGLSALDAKYKFLRIGISVEALVDSHMQAMLAATLEPGDVAVGISVSGSTKDTLDCLTIAKEAGAKIISITHYARSPITKISDMVLLISAPEGPLQGGSLSSKIAQLHVIDILSMAVSQNMEERSQEYKEKTAKSVLNKIY